MSDEEAAKVIDFRPVEGFHEIGNDESDSSLLRWYCAPDSWKTTDGGNDREGRDGSWSVVGEELVVAAPAKKDFWRKTYYVPLMVKDDGPFLYGSVPFRELPATIETGFTFYPKCQFDQAGICIRIDPEHWIKTGIEYVDGQPKLSCVVCNGFSDWSTQDYSEAATKTDDDKTVVSLRIRVHMLPQHGGSFVVESCPYEDSSNDWSFLRIAHLNQNMNEDLLNDHPTVTGAYKGESAPRGCLMAGVFAACPVDQNQSSVTFHTLSITKGSSFEHEGIPE